MSGMTASQKDPMCLPLPMEPEPISPAAQEEPQPGWLHILKQTAFPSHSTVTDFAKFLGLSTSQPFPTAT